MLVVIEYFFRVNDKRFNSENCKLQITILHFAHVVLTYVVALIKTPKEGKGREYSTLLLSIALSRVFCFVFKLVFYVFSNLQDQL